MVCVCVYGVCVCVCVCVCGVGVTWHEGGPTGPIGWVLTWYPWRLARSLDTWTEDEWWSEGWSTLRKGIWERYGDDEEDNVEKGEKEEEVGEEVIMQSELVHRRWQSSEHWQEWRGTYLYTYGRYTAFTEADDWHVLHVSALFRRKPPKFTEQIIGT
jgi:hypothetical protein